LNRYFLRFYAKAMKRKLTPNYLLWRMRGFSAPSPQFVKINVLKRNGIADGTWVETGTYLGDTTKYLATNFQQNKVITLEPDERIYRFTAYRLRKFKNVEFINGSSELEFDNVLSKLQGSVNFWLDGHFSGDITFKGNLLSPVIKELEIIQKHITKVKKVCVLIDDVRDFNNDSSSGYPSKNYLVDWANRNNLVWQIEQDIFIAKSKD
jgi:hypothetical protein